MAQREIRRQQILDRAKDVFAKKGYHAAKIDDVVAAAGVARGTFYLYFHDKRAIFEELVSRFFQRIAITVTRIAVEQPIEPQIKANVSAILAVFAADPAMAKILLTDAVGMDVEFDRRLLAFYSDIESFLASSLEEGQQLGIVHRGDTRVLSHFLIGGIKEVLLQLTRAPVPVDRDAIVNDVYSILSRGVLLVRASARAGSPPRRPRRRPPRKT
ncbi:MAG: TetR/AcrR family transcriptional regulator [Polyangiales bacterium]